MTSLSDGQLVRRALEGEVEAFGELVHRYQRPAYFAARSIVRSHELAEDVAQDAFLVALERLEECRKPDRFASWFLTIVRNRARNAVRAREVRRAEPLEESLVGGALPPDEAAERGMLAERLSAALEEIPEVRRTVVLLHDLEGWKHREIAEALDLPPGTVRSHLHWARKRLRELMDHE